MAISLPPILAPDAHPASEHVPGFYAARIDPERRRRNHVRQLEAFGYMVILECAA